MILEDLGSRLHASIFLRSNSLRQKLMGFNVRLNIATRSSILDIAGIPDPPLITMFGKLIFNLKQATVISFNLIVIYGRSYLYGNYGIIFY